MQCFANELSVANVISMKRIIRKLSAFAIHQYCVIFQDIGLSTCVSAAAYSEAGNKKKIC